MKKYTNITSTPNVVGGLPVVVGTRIPIEVIVARIKQEYTLKEIHEKYDWVTMETLEGVIQELSTIASGTVHDQEHPQTQATAL